MDVLVLEKFYNGSTGLSWAKFTKFQEIFGKIGNFGPGENSVKPNLENFKSFLEISKLGTFSN